MSQTRIVRALATALSLTALLAACGEPADTALSGAPEPAAAAKAPVSVPERVGGLAPVLGTSNPDAIPGQYIVVFRDGVQGDNLSAQSEGGLISMLSLDPQGAEIRHIYGQALEGFAAKLSAQNVERLRQDERVLYIEQDGVMRASATQTNATWGLDRIDQRSRPLNGSFVYGYTGSGVTAYIIDTGIYTGHSQFGGRASWAGNWSGDGRNADCNGHGTHVAGTVGGSTYGVAKAVRLVGVKVLACDGSGSTSGIIAGVNWVASNARKPAVANLSLGGGASSSLDTAVNNLVSAGVFAGVAAGNENQDACNVSPARAANAFTVGATTSTDSRASYSNYGGCLNIFAPGSSITSAWYTSSTATNTISGTSMATPHVVGVAAQMLQYAPSATPSQVANTLLSDATTNVVSSAAGSPNRLLFTDW